MKTGKTRSLKKLASGPCVAFLALSMTFGVSAVRADSETSMPSLQEMFLSPIMDVVHAVEARLASLETTVASFAGSFNSRQITSQELCIADQSGAQTCITKAQLDALLVGMARTAAAEPAETVVEVVPAIIVARAVLEPAVIEPAAVEPAVIEPAAVEPAVIEPTAVEPAVIEPAAVEPAVIEPADVEPAVIEPAAVEPAVIEPAVVEAAVTEPVVVEPDVIEPAVLAPAVIEPATAEPAVLETTGPTDAPASIPADAAALDIMPSVDEPAITGSLPSATTGVALISHPDVESFVAGAAPAAE
jgi:hypothetical protein